MKTFNGQISISRDLRRNKQVVLGKYDMTDIIFLLLGVSVALIIAYLLGFSSYKKVDGFTAILISIIPMVVIISFGFRKVADIRQFNYVRMKILEKKSKVRVNRIHIKNINGDKYIAGFIVDKKYVNKYINKFLQYENLSVLSVRYMKDIETNKNVIYILLDLRYQKDDDIFIDLMEKFSLNKEIKVLSKNDLLNLQNEIDKKFGKTSDKNDEYKKYYIYMLNLYDIKVYKKFINTVKRYSDVICYFKRDGKKKFVNTFLLIEDEIKKGKKQTKLEKIEKLSNEHSIILDKLINEQVVARNVVGYYMINPFNNYRVYK